LENIKELVEKFENVKEFRRSELPEKYIARILFG